MKLPMPPLHLLVMHYAMLCYIRQPGGTWELHPVQIGADESLTG